MSFIRPSVGIHIELEVARSENGEFKCMLCVQNKKLSKNESYCVYSTSWLSKLRKHVKGIHVKENDFLGSCIAELYLEEIIKVKRSSANRKKPRYFNGTSEKKNVKLNLPAVMTRGLKRRLFEKKESGFENLIGMGDMSGMNKTLNGLISLLFDGEEEKGEPKNVFLQPEKIPKIPKIPKLYTRVEKYVNTVVLNHVGKKAGMNFLQKKGFSHGEKSLRENPKDGTELYGTKVLRKAMEDVIEEHSVFIVGVDNANVKRTFAKGIGKKGKGKDNPSVEQSGVETEEKISKLIPMTQKVVFFKHFRDLGIGVPWQQLFGVEFKKPIKVIRMESVKGMIDGITVLRHEESKKVEDIVQNIIACFSKGSLGNCCPFGPKQSLKMNPKLQELLKKGCPKTFEDLSSCFKQFFRISGYWQQEASETRCASKEDFMKNFASVQSKLPPGVYARVADLPGYEATRKEYMSILGSLHVGKYVTKAFVNACWDIGFPEFQKTFFGQNRDTRMIPHGYLKEIQQTVLNFGLILLRFCIETLHMASGRIQFSFSEGLSLQEVVIITKFLKNPRQYYEIVIGKGKIISWTKGLFQVADILWNFWVPFVLFKKSIRTNDSSLYVISLKRSIPCLSRTSCWGYLKGIVRQVIDYEFLWTHAYKRLFSRILTYQTKYGTFIGLDEFYEMLIGNNKGQGSTNPVSYQARSSRGHNIGEFGKFISSESSQTLYKKCLLLSTEILNKFWDLRYYAVCRKENKLLMKERISFVRNEKLIMKNKKEGKTMKKRGKLKVVKKKSNPQLPTHFEFMGNKKCFGFADSQIDPSVDPLEIVNRKIYQMNVMTNEFLFFQHRRFGPNIRHLDPLVTSFLLCRSFSDTVTRPKEKVSERLSRVTNDIICDARGEQKKGKGVSYSNRVLEKLEEEFEIPVQEDSNAESS